MKLCKQLDAICISEAKAQDGDWRISDGNGRVRGKQFTVGIYDKKDGWLPVPELDSDSEKEAVKKAKAYLKKHNKTGGKQFPTEIYKGHDESANEAFDVDSVIQSVIDAKPSKDNADQGRFTQLLKGLAFSDDKKATSFMSKVMGAIDKSFAPKA